MAAKALLSSEKTSFLWRLNSMINHKCPKPRSIESGYQTSHVQSAQLSQISDTFAAIYSHFQPFLKVERALIKHRKKSLSPIPANAERFKMTGRELQYFHRALAKWSKSLIIFFHYVSVILSTYWWKMCQLSRHGWYIQNFTKNVFNRC